MNGYNGWIGAAIPLDFDEGRYKGRTQVSIYLQNELQTATQDGIELS